MYFPSYTPRQTIVMLDILSASRVSERVNDSVGEWVSEGGWEISEWVSECAKRRQLREWGK